jgi:hypothetical protein
MAQPEEDINPRLQRTLLRFQKLAEQAASSDASADMPKTSALKVYQLPLWPEPVRGAPNAILRSALFAGIHSKTRQILGTRTKPEKPLEPVLIAAQAGITIKFAGLQLNQYDASIFFEALHRARHHPLETECFFRGYEFLRTIGRSDSTPNYEDLHDSLTRLRDGRVVIDWMQDGEPHHFEGGLISEYERQSNKLYKIIFSKRIKQLFAPACWTQLEWEQRQALKGHPQAEWLYGYFYSHADPFPVSIAFLHEKSGSNRRLLKNYRTDLKAALATLEKVLGWKTAWENDLVTIKRPPTPSQARYLIRNAKKTRKRRAKLPEQRSGNLLFESSQSTRI